MFCPKCGAANPSLTSKCSSCGGPLPIQAPSAASTSNAASPPNAPGVSNTSGMGNLSQTPVEIGGWNWGGFFLGWIWGVGNSVWIALLGLIPLVGLVMAFVLGAKGNEWAWAAKRWDSVEHFKRVQKNWAMAGLILCIVGVVFWVLYFMLAACAMMATETTP